MKKKELLLDFLLHLHAKDLITNHDFEYEKEIKKFFKARNTRKQKRKNVDEMIKGKPLSLDELIKFQQKQLPAIQELFANEQLYIYGGGSNPEAYIVVNKTNYSIIIYFRQGEFSVYYGEERILQINNVFNENIMEPLQRIDYLKQALEAIKSKI